MVEVNIVKEAQNEYSVFVSSDELGGYEIGTYYPGEGIVLTSSDGSAVPLEMLKTAISEMEKII